MLNDALLTCALPLGEEEDCAPSATIGGVGLPEPTTVPARRAISFGPFRLIPAQQLLLEGETPVRLGSRALELLLALVERPGELVSKKELMARVWPTTAVEESNLKVHVAALRRALGDGRPGRRYVATVPGRGYRFVASAEFSEEGMRSPHCSAAAPRTRSLPTASAGTFGRADTIDALLDQLPRRRLITIAGPGGIGKTTTALTMAGALVGAYADGIRFVDLAPLVETEAVPSLLASALGLTVHAADGGLTAYLRDKKMLIVLDSCEHVVEAVAAFEEEVFNSAPGVHILATSREPLRARGEHVHRLAPLESPPSVSELTAADALTFPAIQLFVERAAASLDGFELGDADAPVVAEICRKLDGIPLAIELAATRIDAFGVRELLALLDDRFRLLNHGRRTALPRHRTLAAALDWSYEFLSEHERLVLRRLSVFASAFTLGSAIAVAGHADADVIEAMANLVAKSLISADVSGAAVRYRLLDTTRAYALQKLADSGELEELVRRYAEHHRNLFEQAEAEWKARPTAEWLADYGCKIDDVHNALRWAFSAKGDASIGIALTIAAIPLWIHLSLADECRLYVERALASEMVKPGRCGRKDEIALERSEHSCVAELLRIKGELFRPDESIDAAEDHRRQVPERSRRSLAVGAAYGHELGPAVAPTRQDQRAE